MHKGMRVHPYGIIARHSPASLNTASVVITTMRYARFDGVPRPISPWGLPLHRQPRNVCLFACLPTCSLACLFACLSDCAYGLPAVGVGSDGDISRLSSASATAAASWELGSCCGSASSALSAGCRYESALLFRRRSVDTCQRCSSAGPGERDRALRGDWCDYSDQDLCGVGGRRRRGRSALCSLLHLEDVSLGLVGARGLRQQVRLPAMH